MNRWLSVVAMGLVVSGCAVGVEDPQPPPTPDPEQKDPPAQTFSAELHDPYGSLTDNIGHGITSLPPHEKPPIPSPAAE